MTRTSGNKDLEFVSDFYDTTYNHLARRDIEFFVEYSRKADGETLELGSISPSDWFRCPKY